MAAGCGSQQQLGASGVSGVVFVGTGCSVLAQQQHSVSGAFSLARSVGNQQHQPTGTASRKLQRCTTIARATLLIPVSYASAGRIVNESCRCCDLTCSL
jgi:hypothetical protein